MDDTTLAWVLGLYTVCFLVGYVVPTIVAYWRRHPQRLPIMVANIMLGWTLVVWAGLLIYAFWDTEHPIPFRNKRRRIK